MRIKYFSFFLAYFLGLNFIYAQPGIDLECYKVIIEKCAPNFLPKGGSEDATVTIIARVENSCGTSPTGFFKFTLYDVSTEPGYCMNAPTTLPPPQQQDGGAWKDIQFINQNGFTISSDKLTATSSTGNNWTEVSIIVKTYDYGAYAKIRASFTQVGGKIFIGKEEGGSGKEYTSIPLDDDENFIADNAPYNLNAGSPMDDADNLPAGNGTHGDAIIKWEEYRGFEVASGEHIRLDPQKKDLFVNNLSITALDGLGFVTSTNLNNVEVHEIENYYPLNNRILNFNSDTHNGLFSANAPENNQIYRVNSVVVTGTNTIPDVTEEDYWGSVFAPLGVPTSPSNYGYCHINWGLISAGTDLKYGINATDNLFQVTEIDGGYQFWTKFNLSGGTIRIGTESISYGIRIEQTFENCIRGSNATSHSIGETVYFFETPLDAIKLVFAHEVGHTVNLGHCMGYQFRSIMNQFLSAGATLNHPVDNRRINDTYIGGTIDCNVFSTLQIK